LDASVFMSSNAVSFATHRVRLILYSRIPIRNVKLVLSLTIPPSHASPKDNERNVSSRLYRDYAGRDERHGSLYLCVCLTVLNDVTVIKIANEKQKSQQGFRPVRMPLPRRSVHLNELVLASETHGGKPLSLRERNLGLRGPF
jgi:hypothetical protein